MLAYPTSSTRKLPQSELEWQLITDYLREKGYSHQDLKELPKEQAHRLMTGACRYASLKLAEIEARAKFRQKIHFGD
jgi:hypothetical protein